MNVFTLNGDIGVPVSLKGRVLSGGLVLFVPAVLYMEIFHSLSGMSVGARMLLRVYN